ncbi:hypothetical protein GJAV_G00020480 [Gymnothorax javanicus]|nr:hypothetical protein GJAV_G00020480 [Gymnothorax javanicus]
MKPRGIPRPNKTKLLESHATDSHRKETSKSCLKTPTETNPLQHKPLVGKGFYLDLPFSKRTETLEEDIKLLGGTVEKFFSKDIKYLVSNQKEANRRGSQKGSSQGPLDTAVITSRGKSLVEKVFKEQERIQINRILSNALEWGIKVLYVDDVISYVEKKKKDIASQGQTKVSAPLLTKLATPRTTEKTAFHKCDGGRISKPYVKVEDCCRHYRPIYLHMPDHPQLNLTSAPPCSPFIAVEHRRGSPGKKREEPRNRGKKASGSESCRPIRAKKKPADPQAKKREGFCECCLVKYENVKEHLNSEQHKAFAKGPEYNVVDQAISELTCHFAEIQQQLKRPKCSVSSVVYASGTTRKFEDRKEPSIKLDHSRRDGAGASVVCSPKAETSSPCSAGGTGSLRLRNCSVVLWSTSQGFEAPNVSHKSEEPHKFRVSKSPDNQKYRQVEHGTQEKSTGKRSDARSPETNLGPVDGEPGNRRTSDDGWLHVDADFQCFLPLKSSRTTSSQADVPTTLANHSRDRLIECAQNLCQLKETSKNEVVENADQKLYATESPSDRRLQRKVRNFRRRRTVKKEKHLGNEEDETFRQSLENLWQLFLTSEDMDIEFKGFAD